MARSASEIPSPDTLQHTAETGLERMQVCRVRGYRAQHRGRYQLHRPQRR